VDDDRPAGSVYGEICRTEVPSSHGVFLSAELSFRPRYLYFHSFFLLWIEITAPPLKTNNLLESYGDM